MVEEIKIRKVLAEKLAMPVNDVVGDRFLVEDLGADSLDLIEIIMAMEDEFDIDIPDEDAEKIKTVKDVVNYVQSKA